MNKYIYMLIGVVVLAGLVFLIMSPGKPGIYDKFAQCLKEKEVTFYGAFWCSHCQAQKARFGKSAKYLPYVECSPSDGQGQLQVCKDAGVTTYPTWQFSASTTDRVTGEVELVDLASKSGCLLPTE